MATAQQQSTPLESWEGIVNRVLQLAARVGRQGKDGVDVSYTSLFIALLWLEDDTSKWLIENVSPLGARLSAVYQTRGVGEADRAALRAAAFSRDELSPLTFSPSARRVLAAAQEIANESSTTQPGVVGTRHIVAVYFFRNPPDHQEQLEKEWGFNLIKWRSAFLHLVRDTVDSGDLWQPVFAPYLDKQKLQELSTMLRDRYSFEGGAVEVVQRWWEQSESGERPHRFMRSAGLFEALGGKDMTGRDEETGPDVEESSFTALQSRVILSAGTRHVLDGAQSLAFTTTGATRIGVRHLKAAVMLVTDSNAHRGLATSGRTLGSLKQELFRSISRYRFEDDQSEWRKSLIGQRAPDLTVYRPDDPEKGDDQLDVKRFATAFALLISSKDVAPPLAIGISGNWGSGKSFFMRLMRKETERVTAKAAADPRFLSNVVPIQFNAWHYAEKDLLASLVQTIFQSLRGALVIPGGGPSAAEAVQSRLEKARQEKEKAEQAAVAARAAVEVSRQKLEETRKRAEIEAAAARLNVAEVAAASADQLKGALAPLGLGHLEALMAEGADRAARVRSALAEVKSTGLRTRSAFEWLVRAPVHWPGVIAGLCVLGGTAALLWWFQDEIRQVWPVALAVLTELGAAASLVWRWAKRHLDTVDGALAKFESVRAAIEAKVEEKRAAIEDDVSEAEAVLQADRGKLRVAQDSVEAAEKTVQEAERAAEETKSINRLARLVDERLASRDYEKYLGLVAAVRADFQRLSELIHTAAQEAEVSKLSFRRIDRIVLYIDDLDRCPTDKVILVLEAIHLLLAFDLFVVVVGLDIRWASHSLEEKFSNHLKADGGATALDYLEKIFQVPFWLPPMDEQASRQLLATMLPGQAGGAEQVQPVRRIAADISAGEERQPADEHEGTDAIPTAAVDTQETELLTIQRGERAFLLQLAPAVSRSPRRLKRFVNTYLILRASLDPLERETFVMDGGARGNYREAMMLLALLTSAPRAWERVLEALASPALPVNTGDLRNITLGNIAPGEREYVEAAFDIYRAGPNSIEDLRTMAPKVARFSFHYSFN